MYEVDIKIEYRKFALLKFIKNNGIEILYGEANSVIKESRSKAALMINIGDWDEKFYISKDFILGLIYAIRKE